MDISPRIKKTINGRLLEIGAQWNQPLSWPHLQLVTTCESTGPESFRSEVRLGRHVLLRTEATDDLHKSERAAELAFNARIAALFGV